jgi:uncharacterized protein
MAKPDRFRNRAEAFEAHDNVPLSPPDSDAIGDIILKRYSRREMMRGTLGVAAAAALFGPALLAGRKAEAVGAPDRFDFAEVEAGVDETHHVAGGYRAGILLRWGDPLFADSPPFDPLKQSAAAQLKQFGYNNDYLAFFPLDDDGQARPALHQSRIYQRRNHVPEPGSAGSDLLSRHDSGAGRDRDGGAWRQHRRDRAGDDGWRPMLNSKCNRRISPANTEMRVDGPAAGHDRLKTSADPSGTRILGTLNNCAGGVTPWGTYLTAEENFHGYFWSDLCAEGGKPPKGLGGDRAKSFARYGVPGLWQAWGKFVDRFNVDNEPEPNRFGWIVEIDPFDPSSEPVKHTALGRFRHEGAECLVNKDGRVVIYSGDDARFDYVYRYVSDGRYDPDDGAANWRLLSEGTLSVARFDADGNVAWLPLVYGRPWLTPEFGFNSQADVVIDARIAADLLGATRMDRPEDVQPNQANGRVYVILTNNKERPEGQEDAANPRAVNVFGHIIEMTPPDGDHAADRFTWELLVRCGDPAVAEVGALWNPETSANGWFACPDNAAVDAEGRLWVSTDQGEPWPTRPRRWALRTRNRGGAAAHREAVLPLPGGCRAVRPLLHAGPGDAVPRRAASRRRRHRPL